MLTDMLHKVMALGLNHGLVIGQQSGLKPGRQLADSVYEGEAAMLVIVGALPQRRRSVL